MTTFISRKRMAGLVMLAIIAVLVLNAPVLAASSCPKGKVNCSDPCKQYTDTNSNGICDRSESGTTSNSNNSSNSSNSSTANNSNQSSSANNSSSASNSATTNTQQNSTERPSRPGSTGNQNSSSVLSTTMGQNAVPIMGGVIVLVLIGGIFIGRLLKKG